LLAVKIPPLFGPSDFGIATALAVAGGYITMIKIIPYRNNYME
jgi:hypothetical protein